MSTGGVDLSLHLVTDDRVTFDDLVGVVDRAIEGGVTIVQLRDKRAGTRTLLERAIALSAVVAGRVPFVVDDRVDVALAARDAGARVDGVHLGQSDLPPGAARRLLGPDALIGWTANTAAHVAAAEAMAPGTLDYLGVGVIRPTATKPDHPPALGIDGFARFAATTALPCVAIGGVTPDDVAPLRAAGAAGVAIVSGICAAPDPTAAARSFRAAATAADAETGAPAAEVGR